MQVAPASAHLLTKVINQSRPIPSHPPLIPTLIPFSSNLSHPPLFMLILVYLYTLYLPLSRANGQPPPLLSNHPPFPPLSLARSRRRGVVLRTTLRPPARQHPGLLRREDRPVLRLAGVLRLHAGRGYYIHANPNPTLTRTLTLTPS